MSKALFTLVTLSSLGTVGFIASQALTPASLKAQQQAKELLQTIELVPNGSTTPGNAQAQPEAVITKPEQVVVQRNHYLDAAIASLDTEGNNLVCARAAYYRQMAEQAQTQSGASQEQFLLDLLVSQNQELLNTATQTGGFNGTATLQQTGRSLTLDTLAILQALKGLYFSENKACLSEPYGAGELVGNFLIRAQQYRATINQRTQTTLAEQEKPSNEK